MGRWGDLEFSDIDSEAGTNLQFARLPGAPIANRRQPGEFYVIESEAGANLKLCKAMAPIANRRQPGSKQNQNWREFVNNDRRKRSRLQLARICNSCHSPV
jgi:hypothetical protein